MKRVCMIKLLSSTHKMPWASSVNPGRTPVWRLLSSSSKNFAVRPRVANSTQTLTLETMVVSWICVSRVLTIWRSSRRTFHPGMLLIHRRKAMRTKTIKRRPLIPSTAPWRPKTLKFTSIGWLQMVPTSLNPWAKCRQTLFGGPNKICRTQNLLLP